MARNEEPQGSADAEAKPAGKLKLIILIVVALLLAVGLSVGGTWFLFKKDSAEAETEVGAEAPKAVAVSGKQPAIYEELAPAFVVNFDYKGRARYMQVSVALMTRDQAALDALKVHMPVLRNNLVMLFSSQNFEVLTTPVGVEMLRQQATASVQELAQKETGQLAVEQVLFTNLVLQ